METATAPPRIGPPSLAHGRLCIALAAVLWSLSGAFTKILTQDASVLHVGTVPVHPVLIAFYRVLFAGLALVPFLRVRDLSFRPAMIAMVACFAVMNILYVLAMGWGSAANAVLLQYTGPMWMYLASIWWLGEQAQRRSTVALAIGLAGIGFIIWGSWQPAQLVVIGIALGSGVAYAGVILFLRILRASSSRWLTVLNHLCSALVLIPALWYFGAPAPSQLAILALFGTVQMALPYWLVARGLRVVSPQEAGTIMLLEPLVNPLWAYLVAPKTEVPSVFTVIGGGLIVGGLAWRYWPRKNSMKP
jgi:DME family drug/metabolite transporter